MGPHTTHRTKHLTGLILNQNRDLVIQPLRVKNQTENSWPLCTSRGMGLVSSNQEV
ncbi:hypothetical protein Hanom_Chr12g01088081 [Helianthus anomalus]